MGSCLIVLTRRSIFITDPVFRTGFRIHHHRLPGLISPGMCLPICLWVRKSGRIFLCPCMGRMCPIPAGCWTTVLRLEGFTITIHGRFMARCDTGFISSPGALTLVLILCLLFGLEGCQSKPSAVETQAGGTSYQIRGIVVSSDAAKGVVTID